MKKIIYFQAMFLFITLGTSAQVTNTFEDADATTITAILKKIKSANITSDNLKFVEDALTSFETGTMPNKTQLSSKKNIGVCVGINANGKIESNLELVGLIYQFEKNSHKGIMFGDLATVFYAIPTTNEEKKSLPDAIAKVRAGKVPFKNAIYDFAKSVTKTEDELYRTVAVNGDKSLGIKQENRLLLRQNGNKLIVIELPFTNAKVAMNSFWVMEFQLK